MGLYSNFKSINSSLVNKYANDNSKELVSSLSYLEAKHQKVLAERDEVDAALDGISASNDDKAVVKNVKDHIRSQLSEIQDSKYAGDYDRQVNKIAAKTKNAIQVIEGNNKAEQSYIAEAKKAGLTQESIDKQLAISKSKGSLKYNPETDEFTNGFSGRALALEPDLKTTREALTTLKSKKFEYVDKNGNHQSIDTFSVIPQTQEEAVAYIKKHKLSEPEAMKHLAGVQHYQDIKNYHDSSPEFQAKLERDKEYNAIQASKLDLNKLSESDKTLLNDLRVRYAPKDKKGNVDYDNLPSAKDAFLKRLNDRDGEESLSVLTGYAGLRNQDDSAFKWDDRAKASQENEWDRSKIRLRAALESEENQRKEAATDKKEAMSLNLQDAGSVQNNPYVEANEDGTLKEIPAYERLFKKAVNGMFPQGLPFDGKKKKFFSKEEINQKYRVSEAGINIMRRDYPEYGDNQKIIDSSTSTSKQKEEAQVKNNKLITQHEDQVANELKDITKFQPKLNLRVSKKDDEFNKTLLNQVFSDDLNGWGRSFKAKEVSKDGKPSDAAEPTDFGTLIKESGLKVDSKEFKKALKGESSIVKLDGYRSSDGQLRNGIQVTISDPDDKDNTRTYAIEMPIPDKVYKGKHSVLTETESIQAAQRKIVETNDKKIVAYPKGQSWTHYKVFDKSGKLLDEYNIHADGTGYDNDKKRLEN